jgi:hypothetical protein
MNDQTDSSKGFLKDKLGDYQVNPPEKVWESISDQLGGGRSRRSMLILVFAAAASLALAVTLGVHYFGPDLPQESGLAEKASQGEISPAENSEDALSPLEQRVLETMETEVTERSDKPEETEEVLLSLARQNQPMVEEDEPLKAVEDTLPEDIYDLEQIPEPEALEDPVAVTALTLEENDQLPLEPISDFMENQKRKARWMVGAVVSPLYSFRDAEAHVMAGAGVHESGMLSYSSGIHVNYRRHSRLAFETGIFFNKTGLAIDATGIQSFNQQSDYLLFGAGSARADIKAVTNSVGNIISNSGEIYVNGYKLNAANTPEAAMDNALNKLESPVAGIEQHLDYLELPFNLRYTVIDRTFELQLVGGLSTNFLVNNYVTMETSTGTEEIGYLSNIRNVNYSGNAGLGMIYHVGKKLNFMLEPRFRYFLNSINDSSLPATRPYSIGLYTSLNFTF